MTAARQPAAGFREVTIDLQLTTATASMVRLLVAAVAAEVGVPCGRTTDLQLLVDEVADRLLLTNSGPPQPLSLYLGWDANVFVVIVEVIGATADLYTESDFGRHVLGYASNDITIIREPDRTGIALTVHRDGF